MSTGYYDDKPAPLARLRAWQVRYPALSIPGVIRRVERIDRTYDIPYLGGISLDGKTIYVDRRLPTTLADVPVDKFLEVHEAMEHAIVKILARQEGIPSLNSVQATKLYERAHHIATAAEKLALESEGYDWSRYRDAYEPDFWPIEHEKITRVPPDLAMFPYTGALRAHLRQVGRKCLFPHTEVDYGDAKDWRDCAHCSMFLPRISACTIVREPIRADGWCNRFDPRLSRDA